MAVKKAINRLKQLVFFIKISVLSIKLLYYITVQKAPLAPPPIPARN
jgi:hypothetical protein